MPINRIQQSVDQFSALDLQVKHADKGQAMANAGKAVSQIAGTLHQIKQQKDQQRAQAILDSANSKKAELDLLLADKTAAEQEQIMASSRYKDAYEAALAEAQSVPGKMGEQLKAGIMKVQTNTKLKHLTGLANQIGKERKAKTKESLERLTSRIAVDPSRIAEANQEALAANEMFLTTPQQHENFKWARKRASVKGALEAYTNNGPHHDIDEAHKVLDDPRISNWLTPGEIRTYRKYAKPAAGTDKSTSARNNIISGAIDLKDFRYLRNSQEDRTLTPRHKKQLNQLNGHLRSLAARGVAPDADNLDKLFIKQPRDKSDRDWNASVHKVGKALGEAYAKNPRDYVSSVMGPEFEASLGHGDAVSAQLGSRVTTEQATKLTQDGLQALKTGKFNEWSSTVDAKYGDSAPMVKLEAINRFYHGKTDIKSKQQAAALRVSVDPVTRQLFPEDKLRLALEPENPYKSLSGYIPTRLEEMEDYLGRDKYQDVVTVMQMLGARHGSKLPIDKDTAVTQAAAREKNYNKGIDAEFQMVEKSLVDMRSSRTLLSDLKNGLLENGEPVKLTPEFVGNTDRITLEKNRNDVRNELNAVNLKRYSAYLDEDTTQLLTDVPDAPVYLEPDPLSSGERFRIAIKVPTGRTYDAPWFGELDETRVHYLTGKDGQEIKTNTRDIFLGGKLFNNDWKPAPGPKGLLERAKQYLEGKFNAGFDTVRDMAIDARVPDSELTGDAGPTVEPVEPPAQPLTPEEEDKIAPINNLKPKFNKPYKEIYSPAISEAITNPANITPGPAQKLDKKLLHKALSIVTMIESEMGTKRNKEGKIISRVGAVGPFQIMPGNNPEGIDLHDPKAAAGLMTKLFTQAYNAVKRHNVPGATELDYLTVAARIYNANYTFAGRDTLRRQVEGIQSDDKSMFKGKRTFENNKYAQKFLMYWGSPKKLRYLKGQAQPEKK